MQASPYPLDSFTDTSPTDCTGSSSCRNFSSGISDLPLHLSCMIQKKQDFNRASPEKQPMGLAHWQSCSSLGTEEESCSPHMKWEIICSWQKLRPVYSLINIVSLWTSIKNKPSHSAIKQLLLNSLYCIVKVCAINRARSIDFSQLLQA